MDRMETARFISRFAAMLAEEAERNELPVLAGLLRDAEAEAGIRGGDTAETFERTAEIVFDPHRLN